MNDTLYTKPHYYHLAFPEAGRLETKQIITCFSQYVSFPVRRVLEPACGTGRMLVTLPKYGYDMTGYDLNPEMVAYSKRRVGLAGLQDRVSVLEGDMATIRFDDDFDAALNLINSIGYLITDEDILTHLINTGDSIRSGGIYIIYLGCTSAESGNSTWQIDTDGVKGSVTWGMTHADRSKKLSHQYCEMQIDDNGTEIFFRDEHVLRFWSYADFLHLIKESERFSLVAIYDDNEKPVNLDTNITDSMGNLFYILKVL